MVLKLNKQIFSYAFFVSEISDRKYFAQLWFQIETQFALLRCAITPKWLD